MLTAILVITSIIFFGALLEKVHGDCQFLWITNSFVLAWGGMILLGLAGMQVFPDIASKRALYIAVVIFMNAIVAAQSSSMLRFMRAFKDFLFPSMSCIYSRRSIPLEKVRNLSISVAIGSLFLYGVASASPPNWDSNTYNLSRVMLFISSGSIFPEQAGSLRQIIYELGHDVIYWPDLVFFNIRGLGLASTIEYIYLIGVCQAVCRSAFSAKRDQWKFIIAAEYASDISAFIAVIMLVGSPQQVMQAAITKNDLIVALLTAMSCCLGILYWRRGKVEISGGNKHEESRLEYFGSQLALLLLALTEKSYGPIVGIPLIISLAYAAPRWIAEKRKISIMFMITCTAKWPFTISLAAFFAHSYILSRLRAMYASWDAAWVTTKWTNSHLELPRRIGAMMLNMARILYQIILYPISSDVKHGMKFKPPVPEFLRSSFGVGGDSKFDLIYHASQDSAYPSLLNLILVFSAGVLLWIFASKLHATRMHIVDSLNFMLIKRSMAILGLTSLGAWVAILYNIAYQPWISRFLGPVYIPIYLISAICIGLFCLSAVFDNPRLHMATGVGLIVGCVISLISFFSSLDLVDPQIEFPLLFNYTNTELTSSYETYLKNAGIPADQVASLVNGLRNAPYERLTLCHSEDSWSLVPIMLGVRNSSFDGRNLVTMRLSSCPQNARQFFVDNGDLVYAYLP